MCPSAGLEYLRMRFSRVPRIGGPQRGIEGLVVGIRTWKQKNARRLHRRGGGGSRAYVLNFENKQVTTECEARRPRQGGNVQHGWRAYLSRFRERLRSDAFSQHAQQTADY